MGIGATTGLAAVVLDALAAAPAPSLRAALGPERDDQLRAVLRARTVEWARRATGGAEPLEATHADTLTGLLHDHDGPVLLVAPDVPGLTDDLAAAALGDLAAGVDLSSAPAGDGSPFLVALARAEEELLALVGQPIGVVSQAVLERGLSLGMLRSERRLVTLADALALRADPLAPSELVEILAALGA